MGVMLGMEARGRERGVVRSTFPDDAEAGRQQADYWFAILDLRSDEVIGEIGLVGISRANRRAGLSVLVLPGFRRAGVGRDAIELVLGWAQSELGLRRIELHTLPENVPMQKLAEAAGFTREGVLRDYAFERGRFVDNVVYATLLA